MALKMVKGSIDRMFDKNLQDLVRGIRNHKEDEVSGPRAVPAPGRGACAGPGPGPGKGMSLFWGRCEQESKGGRWHWGVGLGGSREELREGHAWHSLSLWVRCGGVEVPGRQSSGIPAPCAGFCCCTK